MCKNFAHSLLYSLRAVNGGGARGNGQEAFNFLRNTYEGTSEARVRSLLAQMQSCTLQSGEAPHVYFARLYRLRLQLQQVDCTVDDYQLKANDLSGLSAEYIPMLNQLRTFQSLNLTVVNEMLREVYVNDILPKEAEKNPLRGCESDAADTTTTNERQHDKNGWQGRRPANGDGAPCGVARRLSAQFLLPVGMRITRDGISELQFSSVAECI